MTYFQSFEFAMIMKNVSLVALGFSICLVLMSLVSAYHMLILEKNGESAKDIALRSKGGSIQFSPPKTLSEALESWYTLLAWQLFSCTREKVVIRNQTRGKLIFVGVLFAILVALIVATLLSVQISVE